MSLHIIIDGYNLIRQSSTLFTIETNSLEAGREALIQRLARYKQFKPHTITVVFDGAQAQHLGFGRSRDRGIEIVFSPHGELADNVIKRMVAREGQQAVVVTSDKALASYATRCGAATIDSVDFEAKMEMIGHPSPHGYDPVDEKTGWKPTTKKKGPARKRSKRERRSRARTKKL
jgi:predicted RNA-binding protein with PIN domain